MFDSFAVITPQLLKNSLNLFVFKGQIGLSDKTKINVGFFFAFKLITCITLIFIILIKIHIFMKFIFCL